MSAGEYKQYKKHLWVQKEDNVITVGLHEDALENFSSIESLELPPEGELVDKDSVVGNIETDDGTLELYSPVTGTVLEVNNLVIEDSSLIMEDPIDSWLFKIESEEDVDDEEDDDEDGDDEEDDDLEEEEDDDDDEEEED